MAGEAIRKINAEMQKTPDDPYTEIIGHYVIDRCIDEQAEEKVAEESRSLGGAMKAVRDAAKKVAQNGVAVLTPEQVFNEVDEYFTFERDDKVRESAMQTQRSSEVPKQKISLDLESFL